MLEGNYKNVLSRCGWETLEVFYKKIVQDQNAVPGATVAVHTFGELLENNSHLHILSTDGCFCEDDKFITAASF